MPKSIRYSIILHDFKFIEEGDSSWKKKLKREEKLDWQRYYL